MLLKELINKSVYGTIGYINSQESINQVEQYVIHNFSILKEYKNIIVATNFNSSEWHESYTLMWRKYFPECILITYPENRGHNFGTADLDNALFNYCKENNIEWLCKSANDVIIESSILDKEIGEADFYYLDGIGYGGLVTYDFDFDKILDDNFYPQTNFYFINVNKTDYINDNYYLNQTYNYIQNIDDYNGKVWEYIENWSCERFLRSCVERNNLKKEHLIPKDKYLSLLHSVNKFKIHDCSHKNIMIEGICHLQFPNENVLYI